MRTSLILGLTLVVSLGNARITSADTKRSRSDKDINAIGQRKLGNEIGNWYSLEREKEIGLQESAALDRQVTLLGDPAVTNYVVSVAEKIARNSDVRMPIVIRVIDSEKVEAFTLAGGYQYISRGLLFELESEGELASVLARGIAHTALRSATRLLTRENLAQIATVPLIYTGQDAGPYGPSRPGVPLTFMKWRREFELEADFFGVQYLYKSGYDPECFVRALERVWASSPSAAPTAKAFSPFPPTSERVKVLKKEITDLLPKRDGAIVSTPEFDAWKVRLGALKSQEPTLKPTAN